MFLADKFGIRQFDGNGSYESWKFRLLSVLDAEGLSSRKVMQARIGIARH